MYGSGSIIFGIIRISIRIHDVKAIISNILQIFSCLFISFVGEETPLSDEKIAKKF